MLLKILMLLVSVLGLISLLPPRETWSRSCRVRRSTPLSVGRRPKMKKKKFELSWKHLISKEDSNLMMHPVDLVTVDLQYQLAHLQSARIVRCPVFLKLKKKIFLYFLIFEVKLFTDSKFVEIGVPLFLTFRDFIFFCGITFQKIVLTSTKILDQSDLYN